MASFPSFERGQSVRVLQFPAGFFHKNLVGTIEEDLSPSLDEPLISVWVARTDLSNWAELMEEFETFKKINEVPDEYGAIRIFVEADWIELMGEGGE